MARARRESNRVPPPDLQTRSEDHSTRLFSPQNIGSVKISYVSKIENVCALPAGAFSEPKIATLCSFGTDNNSFCVLNTEFEDFLHSGTLAGHPGWTLWQDTLAGDSGLVLAAPGC